jgi:uncharacterized alpha-E superfamily protein
MSRYLERAENIARFIDVNFHLLMDLQGSLTDAWSPFIAVTGDEEIFYQRYPEPSKHNVLQFLVSDHEYINSVVSCLQLARNNAMQVRDIITAEMWELINRFYLFLKDQPQFPVANAYEFFSELKSFNRQYLGILDSSLSRDEVWHFCRMGHFMERADKTSRILDVRYFMLQNNKSQAHKAYQGIQWAALLKSVEALEMYRKTGRLIQPHTVVRFLLMDPTFPRSVMHCVGQMESLLIDIMQGNTDAPYLTCMRKLRALQTWLHAETASDFIETRLHNAIDELQALLNTLDDALHETFFGVSVDPVDYNAQEETRTYPKPLVFHDPDKDPSWLAQGGMAQ